jgi:hypothetical protein
MWYLEASTKDKNYPIRGLKKILSIFKEKQLISIVK